MKRLAARFLVGALIITLPGVQPYQAAAQMIGAASRGGSKVRVGVGNAGVSPVQIGSLNGVSALSGTGLIGRLPLAGAPGLKLTPAAAPVSVMNLETVLPVAASEALPVVETKAPETTLEILNQAALQAPQMLGNELAETEARQRASEKFDLSPVAKGKDSVFVSGVELSGIQSTVLGRSRSGYVSKTRAVEGSLRGLVSAVKKSFDWRQAAMAVGVIAVGVTLAAVGYPALGVGLPLAFGVMKGKPGRDVVNRFYGKLQKQANPGERISPEVTARVAESMNLTEEASFNILVKLSRQNRIAFFRGGVAIMSAASARADLSQLNSELVKGNRRAIEGLKFLNTEEGDGRTQLAHHARALYRFEQALESYAADSVNEGRSRYEGYDEVSVLRDNAAMLVLGDILSMHRKGLESADENVSEELQVLIRVQKWIEGEYFDVTHEPAALDREASEYVVGMLGWLNEAGYDEGHSQAYQIREGIRRTADFFSYLKDGPQSDKGAAKDEESPLLLPAPKDESPSAKEDPLDFEGTELDPKNTPRQPDLEDTQEVEIDVDQLQRDSFPLIKKTDSKYKALNEFGTNLSIRSVENEAKKLIGRAKEKRQVTKTLLRYEKNNPIVIGEKGVGKTVLIEGLADDIVMGRIPSLKGKNIFKLDLTKVVAGTTYRGQFEERMVKILDELKKSKGQVVLFIDEIHLIVGAGSASGSQDAAGILKESLATGEISVIGATTLEEFRKIEKDGALVRRFNPVYLEAPSIKEAEEIVLGVKDRYEKKHKLTITDEAAREAVRLADRYITDRSLPDSALSLLDDAASEVELMASETPEGMEAPTEVTSEEVAFEISLRTGIPAGKLNADDLELLKTLPKELKQFVVGQDEAVMALVKAVRRARLGYRDPTKPIVFAELGPTGVGKTELAKVVARHLFGSDKSFVKIDMSDYMEKHNASRLVGAPPGYVGHGNPGELTEPVRRRPHSVVLLDEIEKAHPDVMDILLQVVDEGRLKDSEGRVVDFSNTIIFMTSNVGGSLAAHKKKPRIGFQTDAQEDAAKADEQGPKAAEARREKYIDALRERLRPEFFNRIGKRRVLVFNSLDREALEKILEIQVAALNSRLEHKKLDVRLTHRSRKAILDEATSAENKQYGARPLKQIMEEEIEDALAEAELAGAIKNGNNVTVDFVKGKYKVRRRK